MQSIRSIDRVLPSPSRRVRQGTLPTHFSRRRLSYDRRRRPLGSVLLSGLLVAGLSGAAAAQDEDDLVVLCTPQEDWCVEDGRSSSRSRPASPRATQRMSSGESLARLRRAPTRLSSTSGGAAPLTARSRPAPKASSSPTSPPTLPPSPTTRRPRTAPGPASTSVHWASAPTRASSSARRRGPRLLGGPARPGAR